MANEFGIGTGGFGTMGAGTSESFTDAIRRVSARSENRFRVEFSVAPLTSNLGLDGDVHALGHYTVTPVPGTFDRLGVATKPLRVAKVEVVDALTVDLILDRNQSSYPARYRVGIAGLQTADGFSIQDETHEVLAVFRGVPPLEFQLTVDNRDVSMPQGGGA